MIVSRCELKEYTEMVLDQNGDLVYEYKDSKTIKFTVGERILNWNSHVYVCVRVCVCVCVCVCARARSAHVFLY